LDANLPQEEIVGPYTAQTLAEVRAAATQSGVHIVGPRETGARPRPELALHFYETVGSIYTSVAGGDVPDPIAGAEEFAEFLHDVRIALASPGGPTARALDEALRRYEQDRTGGRR
jgi:hypothetical protein